MGKLLDAVRAKTPGITPEQVQFVSSVEAAFDESLKASEKELETRNAKALEDALKKVIGDLPKDENGNETSIAEQLRAMAVNMDKLHSESKKSVANRDKFQLRKKLYDDFEKIKEDVKSNRVTNIEFDAVRAAAPMTTQNTITGATITTGTIPEFDEEVALIRYPQNFITDIIRSRQRSYVPESKVKREQDVVQGAAQITAEGSVKPLISYSFTDKTYKRDKAAGRIEWSEEFQLDKEALYNAILDLFEVDVLRAWGNLVLDKIVTTAPSYVSTGLDGTVKSPNMYTAIGAGILQVQNLLFQPDVLWMNPADVWGMNLTQDTTGQFVIPPATFGEGSIAGLRLYVSTKIEVGRFLLGQSSTWFEEHSGFSLRIGMVGDQFIRNMQTIVGELFFLMYQAEAHKGSWLYGDIEAINAALLAPAPDLGGDSSGS